MAQDKMSEAYKKQVREHLAWVKAERSAGREPSAKIRFPKIAKPTT